MGGQWRGRGGRCSKLIMVDNVVRLTTWLRETEREKFNKIGRKTFSIDFSTVPKLGWHCSKMPNDLGFEIPDANALKVVYSKTGDIPPLLGLNLWLS